MAKINLVKCSCNMRVTSFVEMFPSQKISAMLFGNTINCKVIVDGNYDHKSYLRNNNFLSLM